MKSITLYPHGKMYVSYLVLKYILLVGLGILFTYSSYPLTWWTILLICADLLVVVLLILQTYEIIRYKIIIADKKVLLYANRDLFIKRHKDLVIDLKGLESMQFKMGINLGIGFISAIVLYYDAKRIKYLNTMRFSRKQINYIINLIKSNAEKVNGYNIEIKEADIQK